MASKQYSLAASRKLAEVFEHDCSVFLVSTGTAANALALSALTPPWGAVFCHEDAHINDDECGALEFFTAGAKLVGLKGAQGKISVAALEDAVERFPRGLVKQVQPASLSLSQATECGTLYSLDELQNLTAIARRAGLGVHMDSTASPTPSRASPAHRPKSAGRRAWMCSRWAPPRTGRSPARP